MAPIGSAGGTSLGSGRCGALWSESKRNRTPTTDRRLFHSGTDTSNREVKRPRPEGLALQFDMNFTSCHPQPAGSSGIQHSGFWADRRSTRNDFSAMWIHHLPAAICGRDASACTHRPPAHHNGAAGGESKKEEMHNGPAQRHLKTGTSYVTTNAPEANEAPPAADT